MAQAKVNDKVKVHYTGSFPDGTVFDSSLERAPFEFTIGQGMAIPGFEKGIVGMNEGDTKMIAISPEDAYGDYREDLLGVVDRSHLPPHIKPEVGMMLQLRSPEGSINNITVKALTDTTVTLDLNHPLAGKALVFEIRLLEVMQP
jgi:peptidylprolyl isomerase